jgi:peptidoglycan/xylan/chitin deacetylase (PgdA/CDA1 family)
MYHRVLPPEHKDALLEQPGMLVSPASFEMHVKTLSEYFDFVHLDDWVRSASEGAALPRRACAITFDDGWRDNFEFAYPVLRRYGVPATIFLVSALVGTHKEFWPNRLARLLSSAPLDVGIGGPLAETIRPALDVAKDRGKWDRESLDRAIVLAKRLGEAEIDVQLNAAGPEPLGHTRTLLDHAEIREMADSGLVRFGSHTRTHCRFRGTVPDNVLEDEIVRSGDEIAEIIGRPVDLFCYPNGDITDAALGVVRKRYAGAVTTRPGWYLPAEDRCLISRIGVHDDVSNTRSAFLSRISGIRVF